MSSKTVADKLADQTAVMAAINRSIYQACVRHARLGNPVVGWRDGKMMWMTPDEVLARFTAARQTKQKRPG